MRTRTNNIEVEVYDNGCDIVYFNNKTLMIKTEDLEDLVDAGTRMLEQIKEKKLT